MFQARVEASDRDKHTSLPTYFAVKGFIEPTPEASIERTIRKLIGGKMSLEGRIYRTFCRCTLDR
jgi:hypothetical protein